MADNYQNNGQSTRDRHAIGDYQSHLIGEPVAGATKPPRLSVYYHKNKFSIEVRTNLPNDRDNGIIRAELPPPVFYAFIEMVNRAISGENSDRPNSIRIKRPDFKKTNNGEPVVDAKLAVGKDKNGVVFMAVLSWNKERPAIMFPFGPGKMFDFIKPDGSPWSQQEVSEVVAAGYAKEWAALAPHYMYNRYVAEEFNRGGNNNNGGNNNYRNNNNSGNNNGGNNNYQNRNNDNSSNGDMRSDPRTASADDGSWGDQLPF